MFEWVSQDAQQCFSLHATATGPPSAAAAACSHPTLEFLLLLLIDQTSWLCAVPGRNNGCNNRHYCEEEEEEEDCVSHQLLFSGGVQRVKTSAHLWICQPWTRGFATKLLSLGFFFSDWILDVHTNDKMKWMNIRVMISISKTASNLKQTTTFFSVSSSVISHLLII